MEAKIIMPWRPEASRQAACDWLVAYYGHRFGADAVVLAGDGGTDDEPFNKSRAVNAAVAQWPEHVCVIADAGEYHGIGTEPVAIVRDQPVTSCLP